MTQDEYLEQYRAAYMRMVDAYTTNTQEATEATAAYHRECRDLDARYLREED